MLKRACFFYFVLLSFFLTKTYAVETANDGKTESKTEDANWSDIKSGWDEQATPTKPEAPKEIPPEKKPTVMQEAKEEIEKTNTDATLAPIKTNSKRTKNKMAKKKNRVFAPLRKNLEVVQEKPEIVNPKSPESTSENVPKNLQSKEQVIDKDKKNTEEADNSSETLTGSWGGLRNKFSNKGLDINLVYKGEASRNFSKTEDNKTAYLENLDIKFNLDAEKMLGWTGTSIFIYGLGNKGADTGNTPTVNVEDIQGTSNIQSTTDDFKLYEFWVQHTFYENKVSLLYGLHDLNSEFYVTDSSGQFFNSSFGVGRDLSQSGANGPSVFPYTSPAIRLRFEPIVKSIYMMGGVFGAQAGDPEHTKGTHVRAGNQDGFLLISEAGILGSEEYPGKAALGVWTYTRTFADKTEKLLNSNGDEVSVQAPANGAYLLLDHNWSANFSTFLRYGVTDPRANSVQSNLSLGMVYKSPFHREHDSVGFGATQVVPGAGLKSEILSSSGENAKDVETSIELNYKLQIFSGVFLQPDIQYVMNPGLKSQAKDAQYGAIRLELNF